MVSHARSLARFSIQGYRARSHLTVVLRFYLVSAGDDARDADEARSAQFRRHVRAEQVRPGEGWD